MLDKVKDYLPIFSAFVLIIGSIRLVYYYSFFGISIAEYIELSEIVTLSLSFLINSLITSALFLLLFVPTILRTHMSTGSDKKSEAVAVLCFLAYISYWFCNTYDIFGNYKLDLRINLDVIVAPFLLLILAFIPSYIEQIKNSYIISLFSINVEGKYVTLFVAFAGLFILCVLQSRTNARDILLLRKPDLVKVKIDSTIIESSNNYRFIGKTKNFIFFYNTKDNIADSYALDGGKKISVQNSLYPFQLGPRANESKGLKQNQPKADSGRRIMQ
jgi:hypothetical protein